MSKRDTSTNWNAKRPALPGWPPQRPLPGPLLGGESYTPNTPQNYMKTHVAGQAAVAAAASLTNAEATRLAELRFIVLDTVNYSPYATAEEKAKTAASVARCQSAETLVKWYCNLLTLLSGRELAALATTAQQQQIVRLLNHPAVARPRKAKELVRLKTLTEAEALLAELLTLTTTPTRPAGAGVTVGRGGQLVVAALTCYVGKGAAASGVLCQSSLSGRTDHAHRQPPFGRTGLPRCLLGPHRPDPIARPLASGHPTHSRKQRVILPPPNEPRRPTGWAAKCSGTTNFPPACAYKSATRRSTASRPT
jgi:hypothetical protein